MGILSHGADDPVDREVSRLSTIAFLLIDLFLPYIFRYESDTGNRGPSHCNVWYLTVLADEWCVDREGSWGNGGYVITIPEVSNPYLNYIVVRCKIQYYHIRVTLRPSHAATRYS